MPLKGGQSGQTSSSDGLFIKKKALVKIKREIIFKKSLTKKSLRPRLEDKKRGENANNSHSLPFGSRVWLAHSLRGPRPLRRGQAFGQRRRTKPSLS